MQINIVLSIFSGLLTGLSFNYSSLSFLIWFSLSPFICVIARSKIKERVFAGFLFGLIFYGTSIFWISKVTTLGLVFLLFYLSFYAILFSLLGGYFLKKPLRIITLSSLWVILEFLKENIWCGFGWANLGYSQYRNIYLIQIADLGGAKCVSFLIIMINVLIGEFFLKKKFLLRKAVFVLFILLVCLFYSHYRLNSLETQDFIEVSLIQPNISQESKWRKPAAYSIIERLKILSKETKKDSLVVFPESSWPVILDEYNSQDLREFISKVNRDILIGVVLEEEGRFYNTALLLNKEEGLRGIYRKMRLVPFGEYVPWRNFLGFVKVINSIGDMSPGDDFKKFRYKDKNFSVLICFEDIFPLHVLRFSEKSDFLVNITNDAWFGGEPQSSQHLSIMTLRAIENRISIIRCANTGISGWVSFKGEIEKLKNRGKEVFFPGVGNFKIALNNKRSFYNRYPQTLIFLCSIFLLGVVLVQQDTLLGSPTCPGPQSS
ncbi:MAG: apolipoprotein N-acyltransferase [Candidatus Omnitrophica bacterium]|nr:apolipoprotein N-acyltransferase [Candidatus Omnitrophota bacterium]